MEQEARGGVTRVTRGGNCVGRVLSFARARAVCGPRMCLWSQQSDRSGSHSALWCATIKVDPYSSSILQFERKFG